MTRISISLIGFPAESFHMVSHRFDDLAHFDASAARAAVRDLVARAEVASETLALRAMGRRVNHAALFLVDGLSHSEELLAMTVQDALGEIPLVGGSSGDGLMFKETGIFPTALSRRRGGGGDPVHHAAAARVPPPALQARRGEDGGDRRGCRRAPRDRDQCRTGSAGILAPGGRNPCGDRPEPARHGAVCRLPADGPCRRRLPRAPSRPPMPMAA
jgi:hypothetical protein